MLEKIFKLKEHNTNIKTEVVAGITIFMTMAYILAMPLFYSISEGICLGIISYVVLQGATGKAKRVTPLMYILAVLFVLKYIFL